MGGNALKNTTTRRYKKDEYEAICEEVVQILRLHSIHHITQGTAGFKVIPSYRSKESFGDMDILYTTYGLPLMFPDIQAMFSPNEIVTNGNVTSFDYKEFQIDLICVRPGEYKYALSYYSYNDAGNLVGKLAHQMGLKHGHKGLFLPIFDGTNKVDSIHLSSFHDDTLEFFGLDIAKFEQGFDTLDDIFNWVAASPYYNPASYKLENVNSKSKIRDRKRATYQEFLIFGETYDKPVYVDTNNPTENLHTVLEHFDGRDQFDQIMNRIALKKAVKEKFNGSIVSKITKFVGADLGKFMHFISLMPMFEDEMIIWASPEQIEYNIKSVVPKFFDSEQN